MSIDFDDIFKLLVGGVLAAFGWFMRTLYDGVQSLRRDHEAHKIEVAKEYVAKNDLRETEKRLIDRLDRIEEKLDKQIDRD